MNVPSQISFYDLACMLVPGFIILWLASFCRIDIVNATIIEWSFIVVLSYSVGLLYHRVCEYLARITHFSRCPCMLRKARKKEYEDDKTELFDDIKIKEAYTKAYYYIGLHNGLYNLPVLEAQVAFLRNSIPLILLSMIKMGCNNYSCELYILLIVLLVGNFVAWYHTQMKVYSSVFEGEKYINQIQSDEKENNISDYTVNNLNSAN
ncbi:MAG: hypothetical protein K6E96_03085 [Bacteroidales bacterium]|nr:hypothetical protein [Bacteroidales bacterium]